MARSGGGQTPFPGLISSPNTTVATNVKISVNAKCRLGQRRWPPPLDHRWVSIFPLQKVSGAKE